jgi:hypothetical protein
MLLAAPAAFAQSEGPARQVLEACVDALEPDVIGLEDIEATCPDIRLALEQLGLTDLVSENQLSLLSRDGLNSVLKLVVRYAQPPERETIGVDTLAPVLDSLRKPPVPEQALSWYERLKRWFREIFENKQSQAGKDSWLSRWWDQHELPEVVRQVLIYGAVALVVLLALAIIINEVRTAARGRRRRPESSSVDGADVPGKLRAAELERQVRGEQPSALLRLLIATLVKTGRLNAAQGLTHRELTKRARFDDPAQRDSFQKVAQLAEREVFSGKDVASDELGDVLRAGRNLDSQLKGAAR